ncbi:MAG: trypsin-like serine protease [Verrucomicrobia bacterium]|nr:trypsin-like serine protease [Verrucomicrobiota bacterium]
MQRRHLTWFIATVSFALLALPQCGSSNEAALRHSVVKIYATMQRDNFSLPWQSSRPISGNGSGFIINGKRILTNAHVVSNARFIEVKKNGNPRRFPAHVKFAGHDCDLAVLEVEDPAFFEDTTPVTFATTLPQLSDTVTVIGYPMGGSRISLTEGVVSRIDYSIYTHSGVDQHLVLQVDAAINPGNSGGPVLLNGEVVGLAFQGLSQGDNIGYAIPGPVIRHFLTDIADGSYHGYPELGAAVMDTRNAALRESLNLAGTNTGVVVYYIDPYGSAKGTLQTGDVLLTIDGYDIAEDGTVELDGNTVEFNELLERKQWGESACFRIMRGPEIRSIAVPLTNPKDPYTFRNIYDRRPEYCIVGGLVFSPLSREYLRSVGRNLNGTNQQQLLYVTQYAKIDGLHEDRDAFVVLIRRLPHAVNTYAEPFQDGLLSEINGLRIRNLRDMQRALEKPQDGYHVIRFAGMDECLVLNAEQELAARPQILARYGVPASVYFGEESE